MLHSGTLSTLKQYVALWDNVTQRLPLVETHKHTHITPHKKQKVFCQSDILHVYDILLHIYEWYTLPDTALHLTILFILWQQKG
jgi:hypothetical protein